MIDRIGQGKEPAEDWGNGWAESPLPAIKLAAPGARKPKPGEAGQSEPADKKLAAAVEKVTRRAIKAEKALEKAKSSENAALSRIRVLEQTLLERSLSDDDVTLKTMLVQTERELQIYRNAKRNAELAVLDARAMWKEAEGRVDKVRQSPVYLLGSTIMNGFSDWKSMIRLPADLMKWRRAYKLVQKNIASDILPQGSINEYAHAAETAIARASADGWPAAEAWVRDQRFRAPVLARVLLELAKSVRKSDPAGCVKLAKSAVEADPNEGRVKHLGFLLMDTGAITQAHEVIQSALAAGVTLNGTEERRRNELLALQRLRSNGVRLPERLPRRISRTTAQLPVVVIYASQSFPYHWNTNSMRAHGLAQALTAAGLEAHVFTAPGYPPSKEGEQERKTQEVFDGITYHRMPATDALPSIPDEYASKIGLHFGRMARALDAALIIAPSDFGSAYLASVAANAGGAKLLLECTTLEAEGPGNEYQELIKDLENQLLNVADFAISHWSGSSQRLQAIGLPAARILEMPDAIPRFAPDKSIPDWRADPALAGRFVLGYMGESFDGLDLEAFGPLLVHLIASGHDVGILIIGVGTRFNQLKAEIEKLGLGGRVIFAGRPRPGGIAALYAAMDLVVVPQRTSETRRERSHFEIGAALSHGLPVVTNCPVEAAEISYSGCLTLNGNVDVLSATLVELLSDQSRLAALTHDAQSGSKADKTNEGFAALKPQLG